MRNFILFLANIPDAFSTLITLFSGIGINFCIIIAYISKKLKLKQNTTFKIICITSCLVLGLGISGICAKQFLVQVPDIYNLSYYAAVSTLNREGIFFECGTPLKDHENDTVVYVSETPGRYITRDTKIVFNLKSVNTIGTQAIDSSTGISQNMLVENPSRYDSTIERPSILESNIPVNSFLKADVGAILNDSNLSVKVSSQYSAFYNIVPNRIFNWGIHLSSSLENSKEGDVILELNVSIDDRYNVLESVIKVYEIKSDGYHLIKRLDNEINVTYDGKYFNIVCDVRNSFINLKDICVQTISYSS